MFYVKYVKRALDFVLSLLGIVILFPFFVVFTIIGSFKMKGNPFFIQKRPGFNGKIFNMYKFRSMTEEKDEYGNYLPDSIRLTRYGKWLRGTSIDETLELINILKGDMSFVGPRPFLIKDLVFMSEDVKLRHNVRPGLTGLAQVNGRNNMLWEEKFNYDLEYIEKISFNFDLRIFIKTALKTLRIIKTDNSEIDISEDYGDYLLHTNKISFDKYKEMLQVADKLEKSE